MKLPTGQYLIPLPNLASLQEKIEKLSKKASKLSTGSIQLDIISRQSRVEQLADGTERVFEEVVVAVSGPAPKVNGWTFIATLEHDPEGTIIRGVPGYCSEGELVRFRDVDQFCAHCNLKRHRIDTFILRSDQGEYKQVGRNCLRDFLGHESPEALAALAELLIDASSLAQGAGEGHGVDSGWSMDFFLAMTAAVVRRLGFVPRSKGEEWSKTPTADELVMACEDNHKHGQHEDGGYCPYKDNRGRECHWNRVGGHINITPPDREKAEAALHWIREMEPEGLNDYLHNLWVACRGEAVIGRRFGIVASLIAAYQRHLDRDKERQEQEANKPSCNEWFGEVGKRVDIFNLQVVKVTPIEGQYGMTYLHTFRDEEGRTLKWFSSGTKFDEGSLLDVTATIKGHEEYKGRNQTILTRATLYISKEEKLEALRVSRQMKKKGFEEGHQCNQCGRWERWCKEAGMGRHGYPIYHCVECSGQLQAVS